MNTFFRTTTITTNTKTATKTVRKHNATPIGPIDHGQIGTGLGPVFVGLGSGLGMLGLDLVKLPSYVVGDALTPPKVIALEVADALVHVFDLQVGRMVVMMARENV